MQIFKKGGNGVERKHTTKLHEYLKKSCSIVVEDSLLYNMNVVVSAHAEYRVKNVRLKPDLPQTAEGTLENSS